MINVFNSDVNVEHTVPNGHQWKLTAINIVGARADNSVTFVVEE